MSILGNATKILDRTIGYATQPARFLGKHALIKSTPKNFTTLGIGYKATGLATAATFAAVGAWGIGTGMANNRKDTMTRNAEYVGNPSAMDYDATANVDRRSGERNFSATGDIVFGLNNMKHG